MKTQPPYYDLDHETRRLVETVCETAQDLASVQYNADAKAGIHSIIDEVAVRLGLELDRDEPKLAEVVPLRRFTVIEPTNEE